MTAIAYVVSRWGAPTQTFVRREAMAVATQGVDVVALSLRRPRTSDSRIPVVDCGLLRLVTYLLLAVVRRPARTLVLLASVARRSALRNLFPQLAAAASGIAWAAAGQARNRTLHAHFGWVAATAAWAAGAWADTPFTVVLHAFELHTERLHDRFTAVPLRAAHRVYVVSERDTALVRQRWGVDAEVLRMGVPRAWMDEGNPAAPDPYLLVAVGSLVEKKGHAVLLEAFARCPEFYRLEIVGEGPLRAELTALRDRLGVADRVELPGEVGEAEVRRRLSKAWVSVLACVEAPSGDRDGVPVALMEAMAAGAPVVSTTVGAIPELVAGVGFLVSPGDPVALAEAIVAASEPATRAWYGKAGRDRVAQGWTVERSAQAVALEHGSYVG